MLYLLSIDYEIFGLLRPTILNLILGPIVGLINSYLISNICDVKQLSIQSVSNQVINIIFGFVAFLPIILSPLISEFNSKNRKNKIIELMNNSVFLYFFLGLLLTFIIFNYSSFFLNFFISSNSIYFDRTINYLKIKSLTFPLILVNSIINSVLKGIMDFRSPIKINLISQTINIIFDLILINFLGINGSAISNIISEIYIFIAYYNTLKNKEMIKFTNENFTNNISKLLSKGFFIQIRSIVGNYNYFIINKQISLIDNNGFITASHILSCKILEILSILFSSLSSISPIIIAKYNSNLKKSKSVISRLLFWGFIVIFIETILTYFSKNLINFLTNELTVISQIYNILPVIVLYSSISGISLIVDGILQGKNQFSIQTYLSLISLALVYFTISYCSKLIHIWYLITMIFLIRVPINIYFLFKNY